MSDASTNPPSPSSHSHQRKRDDLPKNLPSENLDYRIGGLEQAKLEPGMTPADIAALDRSIAKLKTKKAEKETKPANSEEV